MGENEKDKGGKTLLMLGAIGALAYFLLKKPTYKPPTPPTITPTPQPTPQPTPTPTTTTPTPQPQPLPCCQITPTQPQPQPQPPQSITTPTQTITPQPTAPAPTPQPQPQPVPQPQPAPAPETTTIAFFLEDPQRIFYYQGIVLTTATNNWQEMLDITPTPNWTSVSGNPITVPNGTVTIRAKPVTTYAGNTYTCKQIKVLNIKGEVVASGTDTVTFTAYGGRYDVYFRYY